MFYLFYSRVCLLYGAELFVLYRSCKLLLITLAAANLKTCTMQSALVMCLAAVLGSTSASSSFTLHRIPTSKGLFSLGISGDWYLLGLNRDAVSTSGGKYTLQSSTLSGSSPTGPSSTCSLST